MKLTRNVFSGEVYMAEDCMTIQRVLLAHGYLATLDECEELWDEYSSSLAAGWLDVREDMAWECVKPFIES